jgi:ectoine hydroxylase-related dioxygenase (phytanoyl-CoA dioxygenase family)
MGTVQTELPRPTRDLTRAKGDIDRFGYSLIEAALSADEVKRARDRLVEVAAEERANGAASLFDNGQSQSVNVLVNKGRPFIDLVEHPIGLELMSHILGEHLLLSNAAALIRGPGGPAQIVHTDQTYIPEPWQYPCAANIIWMLDDFSEANGATRVVPGSHVHNVNPPGGDYTKGADPAQKVASDQAQDKEVDPRPQPQTIPIEAPAGTALVFEGRLWHCGGANTTSDQHRHGAITYYCKPFVRQQENFFRSLDPAVLAEASPTLRRLLGYEPYFVLGVASR